MQSAETIFRMFVAGKMSPFYERYYPGMLMYASRLLGDNLGWMADDCVQDAVMDAFQKRYTFKDASQWRAHILTCIRNKSVSALRRLSAMRNYTADTPLHELSESDAARAMIEHEMIDALYAAIEDLPADYRALLRMSFEEGLKNSEIAQRLEVAEITVKKRKARMLEMLRDRLGGEIDMVLLTFILLPQYTCASPTEHVTSIIPEPPGPETTIVAQSAQPS
ncbi:MAG: RNA polymerase sigma factor [Duncaniella sp.]|nr:RNA polymerase sigma factor [Duncaniella sp.]